jgi:hypothetical protein
MIAERKCPVTTEPALCYYKRCESNPYPEIQFREYLSPTDPKRPPVYSFLWGNNAKRKTLKGRLCRILAVGKRNSIAIEFLDDGQTEIVSRRALKKVTL